MTDIFFSYRSVDRERVRPIHDAFAKQGFEVFWDQEVPSGVDWDTWIRQHLGKSKCAVVFWSVASVESDNVRHEATVAKRQGKLITVLLEQLTPDQFPMGLYSQQAVNLSDWKGDYNDAEWRKLNHDIESKLTPPWVQRKVFELEAELVAERARRERAENRDRMLQAQIAKEVLAQEDLKRERDRAIDETAALKTTIDALSRERSEIEARAADLSQRVSAAEAEAERLTAGAIPGSVQTSESHWLKRVLSVGSPALQIVTLIAALGTVVFWIHMLTQPQTPAVSTEWSIAQESPVVTSGLFTIKNETEAVGNFIGGTTDGSMETCEQSCQEAASCKVFTYGKSSRICFLYSSAKLQPNKIYDSGVRN